MSGDETDEAAKKIGFDWRGTPLSEFFQGYLDRK
jgi:hypothetical protein